MVVYSLQSTTHTTTATDITMVVISIYWVFTTWTSVEVASLADPFTEWDHASDNLPFHVVLPLPTARRQRGLFSFGNWESFKEIRSPRGVFDKDLLITEELVPSDQHFPLSPSPQLPPLYSLFNEFNFFFFLRFHLEVRSHHFCLSLCDLSHLASCPLGSSTSLQMVGFPSCYDLIIRTFTYICTCMCTHTHTQRNILPPSKRRKSAPFPLCYRTLKLERLKDSPSLETTELGLEPGLGPRPKPVSVSIGHPRCHLRGGAGRVRWENPTTRCSPLSPAHGKCRQLWLPGSERRCQKSWEQHCEVAGRGSSRDKETGRREMRGGQMEEEVANRNPGDMH